MSSASSQWGPYVDGAAVPGRGAPLTLVNPSTGRPFMSMATPDPDGVNQAVTTAREAFDDGRWRDIPVLERQRIMGRAAALVRAHDGELAALISEDMGMPESAARYVEVPYAASVLDYYAGLIAHAGGETVPVDIPGTPPHFLAYTERVPVGVAALITPFNFPLLIPAWKLAPALASGSTAVLKPAPEAPRVALYLVRLLEEAGVPPGVLNVLPGDDGVGRVLIAHPGVDKVSFTGSTAAGREVAAAAGGSLKRLSLELGGKSAAIVFEDADLDNAVNQTLFGLFFNSGQVCQATGRILVAAPVFDAFVSRYRDRAAALAVGAATDPFTDLGPVVREAALQRAEDLVGDARARGATLSLGGHRLPEAGSGFYFAPTVLTDLPTDARVLQEEVFGPVACISRFETDEEAVSLANATPYGLAAAVFTEDIRRAHRVARSVRAGTVWINITQVLSPTLPFGGFKASGIGRELGRMGLDSFTEWKTVLVDLNESPATYF
jgi:phenylacetaldehyde dehydrogenase